MFYTTFVVVTCKCGTLALNSHRSSQDAWKFAAAHVTLTGKCQPEMVKRHVPVAL